MIFQEELKNYIKENFPEAQEIKGGKSLVVRCRDCGDSRNTSSRHMYISLGYDNKPPMYNCFKCDSGGLLTPSKLLEWGLFDGGLNGGLIEFNKQFAKSNTNTVFKQKNVFNVVNNYISDSQLSNIKLQYINNRLGLNLTFEDLLKEKIVLNLKDFLFANNIQTVTRNPNIIEELNNSFIGFVSQDNGFINLKNLRPGKIPKEIDTRYTNYAIFNNSNADKFYTIPTNIDLSLNKNIKLNIAEGPFDILSVYHNLRNKEPHSIYSAICGKSYLKIIEFFICEIGLLNLDIHIYMDNDIESYIIPNIVKYIRFLPSMNLYVHQNVKAGEKDFGVNISRIDEKVTKLI